MRILVISGFLMCIMLVVSLDITRRFKDSWLQLNLAALFIVGTLSINGAVWIFSEDAGEPIIWIVAILLLELMVTGVDGYVMMIPSKPWRRMVMFHHAVTIVLTIAILGKYLRMVA